MNELIGSQLNINWESDSAFLLVAALIIAAFLAFLVGRVYLYFGSPLSDRRVFARNFVLIATTTALIITVIKSSIALSLGLVGALSIVRFRAAIKEPEEIAYIFLVISIGIGLGAQEFITTILAVTFILLFIIVRSYFSTREAKWDGDFSISIISDLVKEKGFKPIEEIFLKHTGKIVLKRYDENPSNVECLYLVEFDNKDSLNNLRQDLLDLDKTMKIVVIDNKGLF